MKRLAWVENKDSRGEAKMKRPMIAVGIFFLVGVAVAFNARFSMSNLWLLGCCLTAGYLFMKNRKRYAIWLLLIFLVAGMHLGSRHQNQATLIHYLECGNIQRHQISHIEGRMTDIHHNRFGHVSYSVEITGLRLRTSPRTSAMGGRVMVEAGSDHASYATHKPGDRIIINQFSLKESLLNNVENNYYQHLKERGFQGILKVESKDIQHVSVNRFYLMQMADKAKYSMQSFVQQYLDPPESMVLKSIMLGNQGYLSSDVRRVFARTGTAHIIAVSGLHTGIIAMAAHEVSKALGAGLWKAKLITIALVWFYALMAGFPISILRAGFMITIMLSSFYLQRHYDPGNALMLAAMIFVAIDPSMIGTISFQLSFLATASIIWGMSFVENNKAIKMSMLKLLIITLIVQIGTWPIVAYHFKEFSIISPLSNVLIVPLLGMLMMMTLAAWSLNWIPLVAGLLMHVVNGILIYMIRLMSFLAEWNYAAVSIEVMTFKTVVLYYLMMAGLLLLAVKIKNEKHYIDRKVYENG